MLAGCHEITRSRRFPVSVVRKVGVILVMASFSFGSGAAVADTLNVLPGQSLEIFFTLPDTIVGTVEDLEVVPANMSTTSTDPNIVADEAGQATLFLGSADLGSGVFHNFETFSLGAFADPVNSIVSPAVAVPNFASFVAPGETGVFKFAVLQAEVTLDLGTQPIELGNGNGTYFPDNSPTIDEVLLVPEPPTLKLLAGAAVLLIALRWYRRSKPSVRLAARFAGT